MTDKKAKDTQSRSWFIVVDYVRDNGVAGITPEDMKTMSNEEICQAVANKWASDKKQAAITYCRSASGMDHLHGILSSNSTVRFSTIKNFLGEKAHIEMTQGTKKEAEDYINKMGKYAEKGEVILAKFQVGEIKGRQGGRSDIQLIRDAINEGLTWRAVMRLEDRFYSPKYVSIIKNMYFDKRNQETPFKRDVKVHWLVGDSGSGKTGITLDLLKEYGEDSFFIISDYQNPFDGYAGERIIILDEFRGQIPYAVLLGMLEGYKKEMHARYANVIGLWDEVYISTIKTPEEVYSKMMEKEDTETDPISQLLGRITDISYCYRVNRPTGTKRDRDGNSAESFRYTFDKYKELNKEGKFKSRIAELKVLAELDYYMMYHQEDDTVEAFNIKPDKETKDKEAA